MFTHGGAACGILQPLKVPQMRKHNDKIELPLTGEQHGVWGGVQARVDPNNFPQMGLEKCITLPAGPRCLWGTIMGTVTEKLP